MMTPEVTQLLQLHQEQTEKLEMEMKGSMKMSNKASPTLRINMEEPQSEFTAGLSRQEIDEIQRTCQMLQPS
jgi:hypothetical protein